jgi:ABC-2 type transport system ATP-binding protein
VRPSCSCGSRASPRRAHDDHRVVVRPVRLESVSTDPAAPTRIGITLPDVVHRVEAGERLRLTVATTDQAFANLREPGSVHHLDSTDARLDAARPWPRAGRRGAEPAAAPSVATGCAPCGTRPRRRAARRTDPRCGSSRLAVVGSRAACAAPPLAPVADRLARHGRRSGSGRHARSREGVRGRHARRRRARPHRRGRSGRRAPRPQRCREDDDAAHAPRAHRADRGQRRAVRRADAPRSPRARAGRRARRGAGARARSLGPRQPRALLASRWTTARGGGPRWAMSVADLGPAIDRPVRAYSHGMAQRLAIAQALLGRPELLVLDEPTDGLDPEQIRAMRRLLVRLGAEGHTVLVSSHLLAEVEQTCTHAVVVLGGKVVACRTGVRARCARSHARRRGRRPRPGTRVLAGVAGVDRRRTRGRAGSSSRSTSRGAPRTSSRRSSPRACA